MIFISYLSEQIFGFFKIKERQNTALIQHAYKVTKPE